MNAKEKPGLVSGKKVLFNTLLACGAGLFLLVWVTLRWVEMQITPPAPLAWAERAEWVTPPVNFTRLQKQPGPDPPFQRVRKNLDFEVEPDEEEMVRQLAVLAWAMEDAGDRRDAIAAEASAFPSAFYPWYVLASWEARHGDGAATDGLIESAFARAPAVVTMKFIDELDRPMAGLRLGTIEIACARLKDRVLNQNLRLVYPDLTTDERGMIYLPIYATPSRTTVLPQPEGYEMIYDWEGWFEFPGQTGTLPPVLVRKRR